MEADANPPGVALALTPGATPDSGDGQTKGWIGCMGGNGAIGGWVRKAWAKSGEYLGVDDCGPKTPDDAPVEPKIPSLGKGFVAPEPNPVPELPPPLELQEAKLPP